MKPKPYLLDAIRREAVPKGLQRVCFHSDWSLLAAHVRANHVHVVVTAHQSAEQVMNAFKAYASRALNGMALDSAREYATFVDEFSRVSRRSLHRVGTE